MASVIYDWFGGNVSLFYAINGLIRDPAYETLMRFVSDLGRYQMFGKYFFATLGIMTSIWVYKRILRKQTIPRETILNWAILLFNLLIGYIFLGLATGLTKVITHMPRPFIALPYETIHVIGGYTPVEDYYASCPSGHATFAAFMMTCYWKYLPDSARSFGVTLVSLIAWSRIAMGMHFPADVIVGLGIGMLIAHLTRRYCIRMLMFGGYRRRLGAVGMMMSPLMRRR